MIRIRRSFLMIMVTFSILLPIRCFPGEFQTLRPSKWENAVTLYLWLPALNGTLGVADRNAGINSSISDAWNALSKLKGGFAGHYEGQNGRWGVIGDLLYINLQGNTTFAGRNLGIAPNQTIGEVAGSYSISSAAEGSNILADTQALIGLRITDVGINITGPNRSASGSQTWVDPFVGLRFRRVITDRWMASLRTDVGGFGIGGASHLVYNVVADARYGFSNQWAVDLGWRWLDYVHSNGTGSNAFRYDILMQGPFSGITYTW